MIRLPWHIQMIRRTIIRNALKYCLSKKQKSTPATWMTLHLLWQFAVKVVESRSESHWHKECPNVCTEVTL